MLPNSRSSMRAARLGHPSLSLSFSFPFLPFSTIPYNGTILSFGRFSFNFVASLLSPSWQKGYTLWWHHPASEGGLQPPADQPGISPDLTAVVHAVAAMAQQVGAPPQLAPPVIKEAAARHNPAFAHLWGRPIHPASPDLNLPAHDAWAVHILVPHDTAPKTRDATARVTKQLPNTALHYDIPTPNVIVTHNTGWLK